MFESAMQSSARESWLQYRALPPSLQPPHEAIAMQSARPYTQHQRAQNTPSMARCCPAISTSLVVGGGTMPSNASMSTSPRLNVRTALSAAGRAWGDGRWSGLQVQPGGDPSRMPTSPPDGQQHRTGAVQIAVRPPSCTHKAAPAPDLVIRLDAQPHAQRRPPATAPPPQQQRPSRPRPRGKWSL